MSHDVIETTKSSTINRRTLLKGAGILGLSLPAASMLLTACGSDRPVTQSGAPGQHAVSAQRPTGQHGDMQADPELGVADVTITAIDLDFIPETLMVTAGQLVRLNFINNGAMEHDVQIQEVHVTDLRTVQAPATWNDRMQSYYVQGMPYAAAGAGEHMTVEFTAPPAGIYEFRCMVPGHYQAGMKGSFNVLEPGAEHAGPQDPHDSPDAMDHSAGPPPAFSIGQPYEADRLPLPVVAPPVGDREAQTVQAHLEIKETIGYLDEGVAFQFWTFDGTIPGTMLRVREGDMVEFKLTNPPESMAAHNIDFHAVTGPGGGAEASLVLPGQTAGFNFRAMNPGVFVYHCAVAPITHHISAGMFGLCVVEPAGGLDPVDVEFYIMQSDMYLEGYRSDKGLRTFSFEKMLNETSDYVIFNGGVNSLNGDFALKAKVGDRVRIFFGVGGPNHASSMHVIGEIFDRVMVQGASEWSTNLQTTLVPPGGACIAEFTAQVPGHYVLVDHALGRASKGATATIIIEGDEDFDVFEPKPAGS